MNVLVTGGSGLVGNYLRILIPNGIYLSSKDFDLTKENDVKKMFDLYKPDVVVHMAAKVGGILENIENPATFFTENVLMNTLVLEYSKKNNIKKFIGVLSSCIYPDVVKNYPISETEIHSGPPTKTNFSYGYAKRCMAVQIDSYNEQYETNYQYLIPCNLYGVGDKDDEKKSHFLTSLIKKIYDAKKNNSDSINLFGDGTPLRQFMFAGDFARIIYKVIEENVGESFNIAPEKNLTIKEIVDVALKVCDAEYLKVNWDLTKPNGQFRKDVDTKKMQNLFPKFTFTPLSVGIKKVFDSYDDKIG